MTAPRLSEYAMANDENSRGSGNNSDDSGDGSTTANAERVVMIAFNMETGEHERTTDDVAGPSSAGLRRRQQQQQQQRDDEVVVQTIVVRTTSPQPPQSFSDDNDAGLFCRCFCSFFHYSFSRKRERRIIYTYKKKKKTSRRCTRSFAHDTFSFYFLSLPPPASFPRTLRRAPCSSFLRVPLPTDVKLRRPSRTCCDRGRAVVVVTLRSRLVKFTTHGVAAEP